MLLILGLREDAGLLILPMLLYFSFRDRWKTGFVLSGLSLGYVILAITVLYPWINGISLLGVRGAEASSGSIFQSFLGGHWECRWQAAAWLLLPSAVIGLILRNGWRAFVIFPSTAIIITFSSAMHRQHSFDFHYPVAATTALVCAMVWTASFRRLRPRKIGSSRLQQMAAAGLILATVLAHAQRGYFLGGAKTERVYTRVHPMVFPLLRLADKTPKEGLLLCNQRLATSFAMRPDILVLHYYDPEQSVPEFIITDMHELQTPDFAGVIHGIESGEYGLYDEELPFVSLKRNHVSDQTVLLLERLKQREMLAALMLSQGGTIIDDPAHGLLKQWDGDQGSQRPLLAFGRAIELPAGDYIAHFDVKAPNAESNVGRLSVHVRQKNAPIASTAIQPTAAESFATQSLPFHLPAPTLLEPRIQGAGSPMQARSIRIEAVDGPPAD